MKPQSQKKLSDVRKALSGRKISPKAAATVRGGDGELEAYPWIDAPGG